MKKSYKENNETRISFARIILNIWLSLLFLLSVFGIILLFMNVKSTTVEASPKREVKYDHEDNLEIIGDDNIRIWIDPDTGVQYVVFVVGRKSGYGYGAAAGITPRLKDDGSLYVEY